MLFRLLMLVILFSNFDLVSMAQKLVKLKRKLLIMIIVITILLLNNLMGQRQIILLQY